MNTSNTYLIDTDAISEDRRIRTGRANPHVVAWYRAHPSENLFLSAITIAELAHGARLMLHKDRRQGLRLSAWLDHILEIYQDRIIAFDIRDAMNYGPLDIPNALPMDDAFIAATALTHDMTVVTRNVTDFQRFPVRIENPWEWPLD
jgi:predicted nucleic acid-binding protein